MKQILSIVVLSLLMACKNNKPGTLNNELQAIQIDSYSGSCAYFTKDNNNNIVLSWVREVDTANAVYCYAVSPDAGKSFGKPVEIPGSNNVHPHGENMPKIIFKPSGEIIAAWGAANPNPKNKYSGLVFYSQSFDAGKTWTKPHPITTDTASFDQRYFDLALLPDGEAGIVWLDNRKTWQKEGSGLYFAVTKGSSGFGEEKLISGPCCQCCRTDLFIDRNKAIHVLYRGIINETIRDMVHIVSTDNGKSFSSPKLISEDNWEINGCPHTGPAMAENKNGLHFTWFTGGNGAGVYYNNSGDNGHSFSSRDSVSGTASKHCQIASLPNDNIVIVWNESFVNAGKLSNRIGLEERNEDGIRIRKEYITPEGSNASFPVICPVSDRKAILAYTENIKDKDYILIRSAALQ